MSYLNILEASSMTLALYGFRCTKHSCCICHFQAKELCSQTPDDVCERDHGHLQQRHSSFMSGIAF